MYVVKDIKFQLSWFGSTKLKFGLNLLGIQKNSTNWNNIKLSSVGDRNI